MVLKKNELIANFLRNYPKFWTRSHSQTIFWFCLIMSFVMCWTIPEHAKDPKIGLIRAQ